MDEKYKNITLSRNEAKKCFEIEVDSHFTVVNYVEMGNQTALVHTETEPELAGKGLATVLVKKNVELDC